MGMNEGLGRPCPPGGEEETEGCGHETRQCAGFTCVWENWEDWSECDSTCGAGKRQRKRRLVAESAPSAETLYEDSAHENMKLRERSEYLEHNRVQELFISFTTGALSLVAMLGVVRAFQSGGRRSARPQVIVEAAE